MNLFPLKAGILACVFLLPFSVIRAQVHTFTFTDTSETWTVPPDVTSIVVEVVGATGGKGRSVLYGTEFFTNLGGWGGAIRCTLSVTPGVELQINVGGVGDSTSHGLTAFNGGGKALGSGWGGGGGGASDIRIAPYSLNDRVVVAGGGGGGGGLVCPGGINVLGGGSGGGVRGEDGLGCYSLSQGKGGTDTSGGTGGYNGLEYAPAGTLGVGGNGAPGYYGSAGGGGGYYGGGGSINAGAGGGSSWVDSSAASDIVYLPGYNGDGHGRVTITEVPPVGVQAVGNSNAGVLLFPNPAKDVLTIRTGTAVYNSCYISNALGQVVLRRDITGATTQLTLKELPSGIYYVALRGAHGSRVLRFVKE